MVNAKTLNQIIGVKLGIIRMQWILVATNHYIIGKIISEVLKSS